MRPDIFQRGEGARGLINAIKRSAVSREECRRGAHFPFLGREPVDV